jgi:transcription elongation factor GreA
VPGIPGAANWVRSPFDARREPMWPSICTHAPGVGCWRRRSAAAAASPAPRCAAMVSGMHAHPIAMPTSPDVEGSSPVMSSAEYVVLVRELETLRTAHRSELAQRLHDVRTHGTTSDNDDLLAVLEETAVDRARIAQLEDLVRYATVLDDDAARFDGAAGLGSTVEVADDEGRMTARAASAAAASTRSQPRSKSSLSGARSLTTIVTQPSTSRFGCAGRARSRVAPSSQPEACPLARNARLRCAKPPRRRPATPAVEPVARVTVRRHRRLRANRPPPAHIAARCRPRGQQAG